MEEKKKRITEYLENISENEKDQWTKKTWVNEYYNMYNLRY